MYGSCDSGFRLFFFLKKKVNGIIVEEGLVNRGWLVIRKALLGTDNRKDSDTT